MPMPLPPVVCFSVTSAWAGSARPRPRTVAINTRFMDPAPDGELRKLYSAWRATLITMGTASDRRRLTAETVKRSQLDRVFRHGRDKVALCLFNSPGLGNEELLEEADGAA